MAVQSWQDIPALYEAGMVPTVVELAQTVPVDEKAELAVKPFLAMALRDMARYADAETLFLELRESSTPERAALFESQLGLVLEESGRIDLAEQWYRRAIETYPADAARFVMLGAFLAKLGRREEAEEIHRAATRCTEGPVAEAWLNLGFVLRSLGRYDEAMFCFRQALTRDDGYPDAEEALRDVLEATRLKDGGL